MIISKSNVAMSAQHTFTAIQQKTESLKAWVGEHRPDFEGRGINSGKKQVAISDTARNLVKNSIQDPKQTGKSAANEDDGLDARTLLIKSIIEAFTGLKIHVFNISSDQQSDTPQDPSQQQAAATDGQQAEAPKPEGWGVEYDSKTVNYESEQMTFQAQGTVKTADGREIQFNSQISMSREHYDEATTSIRAGDAVKTDPLVINYSGAAADLTDVKFSFDLNSDGTGEQVSFVKPGSGFLAFDKNANGKIDNGTELFGPQSGNGFDELAAYDKDKNGWIDEADSVYKDLKLWTKDGAGKDVLTSLKDAGVGAIYLGNVDSQYTIKNADNVANGDVAKSGVYLNENGSSGTVQQVNLFA